jgi:hypothetical protein
MRFENYTALLKAPRKERPAADIRRYSQDGLLQNHFINGWPEQPSPQFFVCKQQESASG